MTIKTENIFHTTLRFFLINLYNFYYDIQKKKSVSISNEKHFYLTSSRYILHSKRKLYNFLFKLIKQLNFIDF